MKSAKCSECGFVGWADAELCKKCGAAMPSPPVDGADQPQQGYDYNKPAHRAGSQAAPRKGLAVASLVVGIVSCFTFGGLLGIGASAGVILGIVAMVKANRYPSEYGGKGLATGGMVTSVLSIVILVPIGLVAAIAIPNLLASARAANESSALRALRTIHSAEATYQDRHGKYGELGELAYEQLIDPSFTQGTRHGYKFTISGISASGEFECTGVPVNYPLSGIRSFYINETGVIRAADRHGADATRLDAPLGSESNSSSAYRRTSAERPDNEDDR